MGLVTWSSIPRQLPAAPIVLPARIEDAHDVSVQRPHDADAGKHRRPARRCHQDQGFHSGLPLRSLVLGLGKLRDVVAGTMSRVTFCWVTPSTKSKAVTASAQVAAFCFCHPNFHRRAFEATKLPSPRCCATPSVAKCRPIREFYSNRLTLARNRLGPPANLPCCAPPT